MELLNRQDKTYDLAVRSYFEGETSSNVLEAIPLEDEIWTQIRLRPDQLPTGKVTMLPSFFYLRLLHQSAKGYEVQLKKEVLNDVLTEYSMVYPELERSLKIRYEHAFPYRIVGWQEEYYSGWGKDRKKLVTLANLIKSIRTDYWNKHRPEDGLLRKELGL